MSIRSAPVFRETPPLTRGRLPFGRAPMAMMRNTPAYAGKTVLKVQPVGRAEKHPRLRGEDFFVGVRPIAIPETPPLTRGRLRAKREGSSSRKKHPRLRGEDQSVRALAGFSAETPPLTRGRQGVPEGRYAAMRNTPAYAGKTRRRAHR